MDVLEVKDANADRCSFLNVLCAGTTFQRCVLVAHGGGQPSSKKCLSKFMTHWVSWAGWPKVLTSDRGLHNWGVFIRSLRAHGVYVRQAGLESPEQIGRGERHGGLWNWRLYPQVCLFLNPRNIHMIQVESCSSDSYDSTLSSSFLLFQAESSDNIHMAQAPRSLSLFSARYAPFGTLPSWK